MVLAAIESVIAHLIIERKEAHGDTAYQNIINDKLNYLYNRKYEMMQKLAEKKAV